MGQFKVGDRVRITSSYPEAGLRSGDTTTVLKLDTDGTVLVEAPKGWRHSSGKKAWWVRKLEAELADSKDPIEFLKAGFTHYDDDLDSAHQVLRDMLREVYGYDATFTPAHHVAAQVELTPAKFSADSSVVRS